MPVNVCMIIRKILNNINMFFSPFKYLSVFIIKTAVRLLRLPNPLLVTSLNGLFSALITGVWALRNNYGNITTLRQIWRLRRVIRNPDLRTFEHVRDAFIGTGANFSGPASFLFSYIKTEVINCFKLEGSRTPINRLFSFFLVLCTGSLSFINFKPILYWSTRILIGTIASACGILWNESLNAITFLKDYSVFVKELIENNTHFKIPSGIDVPSGSSPKGSLSKMVSEVPSDQSSWLFLIGCAIATFAVSVTAFCIADYYYHEQVNNIPVIGDFIESIKAFLGFSKPGNPDPGLGAHVADAISRTSSEGSDRTVRGVIVQQITPPGSRTGTPMPFQGREILTDFDNSPPINMF